MSYVRWSSVINPAIDFDEEMELYKNGKSPHEVMKIKLQGENSFRSEWYIYWHSISSELKELDSNNEEKRENQYLAMWLSGEEKTPVLAYPEVKRMYDNDDWNLLGFKDIKQIDVLKSCVKKWINDVESEFQKL